VYLYHWGFSRIKSRRIVPPKPGTQKLGFAPGSFEIAAGIGRGFSSAYWKNAARRRKALRMVSRVHGNEIDRLDCSIAFRVSP